MSCLYQPQCYVIACVYMRVCVVCVACACLWHRSSLWGHVSDLYGRKGVMLTGLLACGVFLSLFGLSSTMGVAVANRLAEGMVNSNVAISKAYGNRNLHSIPLLSLSIPLHPFPPLPADCSHPQLLFPLLQLHH